jgi:hypothetical protein
MKKLMIAAAALMVSIAAYGQGQFVFNNRIPPDINAILKLSTDGATSSLAGSAYQVQLLGGATGTAVAQLQPVGATDFRTGAAAGYVNPITATVAGVAGGKGADIYLQVISGGTLAGNTVTGGTKLSPLLGPYNITVQEAPATPGNLPLGTSALVVTAVPEPATLALGVIGLGTLLAIRRRK